MNALKTTLLMGLMTGLAVGVGYLLGGQGGMLIAFAIAAVMNFVSYWFSDKIVLAMYGAQEIQPDEGPDLHALVDELSRRAGIPKPRVYVVPSVTPNAFATGRNPQHAAVAVTEGILNILTREELMAVLAHELGHVRNRDILVGTIAATLAGAISMALGEWISVQSSRELYQKQIMTEKEEIEQSPDEEAEELSLIYQARGLEENVAHSLAQQIISNPETALEALARDELGIDPEELGGSAWEAAITSFLLFAVGAIIPVLPYLFGASGMTAVAISSVLSAIGLFGIGSAITLFTGRGILYSGARQMIFGLIAAAVTFGIGRLIGVSVVG